MQGETTPPCGVPTGWNLQAVVRPHGNGSSCFDASFAFIGANEAQRKAAHILISAARHRRKLSESAAAQPVKIVA
jgi:hypothetical protein